MNTIKQVPLNKIKPIKVAQGVYHIEFEGSELRLLCGMPANAVKMLIKKNIIRQDEKDGVMYETGPNAVLLSDIPVQNGQLSNLSEFPVLQMFYRQGMLIPNHPNNTGKWPVMIGATRQINAQMEYIYIGNYGIDRQEEIEDAGLGAEDARELIRIKKKFAFGRFVPPDQLIKSKRLKPGNNEIIDGIMIRRLSTNIFELEYQGETVKIDLNLKHNENYESPYNLPQKRFSREYLSVVHLGQGDGWDVDRPCTSSVICYQGKIYLIDAIPNINLAVKNLGIGLNEIHGIFLTHVHDDHFNGITSLMTTNRKIKIFTTELIWRSMVKKICALLSFREFMIGDLFTFVRLVPGKWHSLGSLEVKPTFSPHPIETYNFHFRCYAKNSYKVYSHLADIASEDILRKFESNDLDKPGISTNTITKVLENYHTPADLKKIDAGGGLIHGQAQDFANDPANKIVFAHTSSPIEIDQKLSFGNNAAYGDVDVLIKDEFSSLRYVALELLEQYFESVSKDTLPHLANNPIVSMPPQMIIGEKEQPIEFLYLILTGTAKLHGCSFQTCCRYNIGTIIGEEAMFGSSTYEDDYITESHVDALKIPFTVIQQFIRQFSLNKWLEEKKYLTKALFVSPLFSKNLISFQINSEIKENIQIARVHKNDLKPLEFDTYISRLVEKNKILFVMEGEITAGISNFPELVKLKEGNIIGTEVLYNFLPSLNYRIATDCRLGIINFDVIKNFPNIYEHIHEIYNKQSLHILNHIHSSPNYIDFDFSEFSSGIHEITVISQEMLQYYNQFEYEFGFTNFNLSTRALKNFLKLYKSYRDLKLSYFRDRYPDEVESVRTTMRDLAGLFGDTLMLLEHQKVPDQVDILAMRKGLIKNLKENKHIHFYA